MAIPGINFFNGDESNVKPNNSAAPQFMNTIFGAEPTGGAGMDAFVATEPAETATEVDASEAAEPADPSEAPKKSTKKTSSKYVPSEKTVRKIAESWQKRYPKQIKNLEEFTRFVRKVYDFADKLNINITTFKYDKKSFPYSEKDQIVDEILAIFAEESSFDPAAVSTNGIYYGIFQLSQQSMDECKKAGILKKHGLKHMQMSSFKQLSREKQLDYLLAYAELGKTYSKFSDKENISPKILFAFIKGLGKGKRTKTHEYCTKLIAKRRNDRGQINIT